MSERHTITAAGIAATITAHGAELCSLRDAGGRELLWQAGPEWPRHAPVLFPIVGRLAGDTLHHEGRNYRLTQHGFARDVDFAFAETSETRAVLRIETSKESLLLYPFPFVFTMTYEVLGNTLAVTSRLENPETGPEGGVLPAAIGAHPAFAWPLVSGVPKEDHVILFETEETGMVLSVEGGLLGAPKPLPFDGRRLTLSPERFARDAMVLPAVASRSVRYAALGEGGVEARAITVSWDGYKDLGLWSKPTGAPFLCIEPWYGMASPVGWDGAFIDKPGIALVRPGESFEVVWRVTV